MIFAYYPHTDNLTMMVRDQYFRSEEEAAQSLAESWPAIIYFIGDVTTAEVEPTKRWRWVDSDGRIKAETSFEKEVRSFMEPGDRLLRLYHTEIWEWKYVE